MPNVKEDMDKVINELESRGVNFNTGESDVVGLGDVVEEVLSSVGITEERFKNFFGLSECNCSKRKKWLNNLFSWHKNKKEE